MIFIEEIERPSWLANIVPVKKKGGQIRICVDFRDLSKACPKDEFPFPNVEILVDVAARHERFPLWIAIVDIIKFLWSQRMPRKLPSEHLLGIISIR